MPTFRFLSALILAFSVLISQAGIAFAAPALQNGTISGTITGLSCKTDPLTGIKTFLVTLELADGTSQTVLINQATAEYFGLIEFIVDGTPDCTQTVLDTSIGMEITIAATDFLKDEEFRHPVGDAMATFFEEITDYETIMRAHNGELEELEFGKFGFGVLAQALWLTTKLEGDSETFIAILLAKKTDDYSTFSYENDIAVPQTWGQFRKLILDGEKNSLGIVKSEKNKDNGNYSTGNGIGQGIGNGNDSNKHNNQEKGNKGNSEDRGNGKKK